MKNFFKRIITWCKSHVWQSVLIGVAIVGVVATSIALPIALSHNDEHQNDEHQHTFSSEWSMNDEKHWHAATCEHIDLKSDEAPHVWGEWSIKTPASHVASGLKERECSVCHKVQQEAISPLEGHTFNKEVVDGKYLKSAADCVNPAVYYKSCECGLASATETFTYGEALGHNYGEWIVDTEPTLLVEGTKHKVCSRCGDVANDSIAKLSVAGRTFDFSYAYIDSANADKDEINAAKVAEGFVGNDVEFIEFLQSKYGNDLLMAASSFMFNDDTTVVTQSATIDGMTHSMDIPCSITGGFTIEAASMTFVCSKEDIELCYRSISTNIKVNYVYVDGGISPEHVFDQEVASEEYLKSAADCENPAVYYKSCECGEASSHLTFTYGDPLGHDIGNDGICKRDGCSFSAYKDNLDIFASNNVVHPYNGKIYLHFKTECESSFKIGISGVVEPKFDIPEIYKASDLENDLADDLGIHYYTSGSSHSYVDNGGDTKLEHYTDYCVVLTLLEDYKELTELSIFIDCGGRHVCDEKGVCEVCDEDLCVELTMEDSGEDRELVTTTTDDGNYSFFKFTTPGNNYCPDYFTLDTYTYEEREGHSDYVIDVRLYEENSDGLLTSIGVDQNEVMGTYYNWHSVEELKPNTQYYVVAEYDSWYDDMVICMNFGGNHEPCDPMKGFILCDSCGELLNGESIPNGDFVSLPIGSEGTFYYKFMPVINKLEPSNIHGLENVDSSDSSKVTIKYFDELWNEITSFPYSCGGYIPVYVRIEISEPVTHPVEVAFTCGEHYFYNGFCSHCGIAIDEDPIMTNEGDIIAEKVFEGVADHNRYFGCFYQNYNEFTFDTVVVEYENCEQETNPMLFDANRGETGEFISLNKVGGKYVVEEGPITIDSHSRISIAVKPQSVSSGAKIKVTFVNQSEIIRNTVGTYKFYSITDSEDTYYCDDEYDGRILTENSSQLIIEQDLHLSMINNSSFATIPFDMVIYDFVAGTQDMWINSSLDEITVHDEYITVIYKRNVQTESLRRYFTEKVEVDGQTYNIGDELEPGEYLDRYCVTLFLDTDNIAYFCLYGWGMIGTYTINENGITLVVGSMALELTIDGDYLVLDFESYGQKGIFYLTQEL